MQRNSALVSFLLLVSCAWFVSSSFVQEPVGSEPQVELQAPLTLFLVRHAEKGTDDPRDPSLSEEGHARAQQLAYVLSQAGVTHLFSTAYNRTRQTLAPLVEAIGLEVVEFNPRDAEDLSKKLKALPAGAVAVVAGHSNTTPGLYLALCGKQASGLEAHPRYGKLLPESAYDRLFVVTMVEREGELRGLTGVELRY
jgi:phosphohistidine phosphatase SixA